MATEKVWKEFKDEVESKKGLKKLLKCVLNKEREFFTYTWRVNEVIGYGTMYGDSYKVYEEIFRLLNCTQNYSEWDSEFTKEVDAGFIWNEDDRSNLKLFNYIFDTKFEKKLFTKVDWFVYEQDIEDREKRKTFILSEKTRNFLKKSGYTIYKSWNNLGNNFRLPSFYIF